MFIAVQPYRSKTDYFTDKVLVLDTDDMELEYVSIQDIIKYDIPVSISNLYHIFNQFRYNIDALFDNLSAVSLEGAVKFMGMYSYKDGFYQSVISLDNILVYIKKPYLLNSHEKDYLSINGINICECNRAHIRYMFRYGGSNYIIRTTVEYIKGEYMDVSVAIDNNGSVVAYWSADFSIEMNGDFGRRVDIVSRY